MNSVVRAIGLSIISLTVMLFGTRSAEQDDHMDRGRNVFVRTGCIACHRMPNDPDVGLTEPLIPWAAVSTKVRPDNWSPESANDQLPSGQPTHRPEFDRRQFSQQDLQALTRFLSARPDELERGESNLASEAEPMEDEPSPPAADPAPHGELAERLHRLRCTGCHAWQGRPSAFQRRIGKFVSLNRDQMLRDVLPPSLDGVGARLTPEWLRKVLIDHARVRPWLDVKMPRYEAADVEPLIELLLRADGVEPQQPLNQPAAGDAASRQAARLLIGRTGLNCVGCHDFGEHRGVGVRAPDLATLTERVQYGWFRRWMHNPQELAPGTRMPTMFLAGRSVLPTVLDGREETQIRAIWDYLAHPEGREPPLLPRTGQGGVAIGETDTPIPSDRPLLVHGFLPGHAGLRGLAIGFPTGLHFAVDTERCLLTRVWQGPYVHQGGWQDSGKGDVQANAVKILGDVIWRDDVAGAVRIAREGDDSFPPTPPPVRYDECWSTRTNAGFAWRIMEGETAVRIEQSIEPLPALGSTAYMRRMRIESLPAGSSLWLRGFSRLKVQPEVPLAENSDGEWLRVSEGPHDWLFRAAAGEVKPIWSQQTETSGDQTVEGLWWRVPGEVERPALEIDLISIRVEQGAPPPVDDESIRRRKALP